jgi:chitinase
VAATQKPTTANIVGTCGNGIVGNGNCATQNLCCSQWGWCGTTDAHCQK